MDLVLSFEYNTTKGSRDWELAIVATDMPGITDKAIYTFIYQHAPAIKEIKNLDIFVGSTRDYFDYIGLDLSVDDLREISAAAKARRRRFGHMLAVATDKKYVPRDTEPQTRSRVIPCTRCRFFELPGVHPRQEDYGSHLDHNITAGLCKAPLPPTNETRAWRGGRVVSHRKSLEGCMLGEEIK